MYSIQPPVASIVIYLALLSGQGNAQCSLITEAEIQNALSSALVQLSSEGTSITGTVMESNINCLAAASTRGYAHTTVTIRYLLTMFGTEDEAQITVDCDAATSTWLTQIDVNTQFVQGSTSFFGGGMASAEELLAAEANRSCLNCQVSLSDVNTPSFCIGESIYMSLSLSLYLRAYKP